ncbi:MAG: hypothetical protein IJW55_09495, partial [Clostridia bacterium]|nr:hypothetical protein [Clostridia bacterium]
SQFDDYDLCFWFALDLPTTIKMGYTLTNPQQLMTAFMQQTDIDKMITYLDEWQAGYNDGYYYGYGDGDTDGYERAKGVWYNKGLEDGFAGADTSQAWASLKNLIFAIFDAPFYVISYSLDFDLFGINIAGTLIALISLAIIVWILKIIVVKLF